MEDAQVATSAKIAMPFALQFKQLLTHDWVLVGLLSLLVLTSRLPLRSHILYHWDSVNFAYAIQEFDMAKEQPQPPGYILFVWLTRVVDSFVHDASTTLVGISLVASVLAVIALFYLGRAMFGYRVGLIAALFLATSPLFWFYSEIALPHTLDTFLVIVSVWCLYETMRGNYRFLYPAIIVLAIAGGVRQQTLVFLIPVTLFALRGVGWRRFLLVGIVGGIICMLWFIPLIMLSGGLSNYTRVMGEFSDRFQTTTSVFMGAGWWGVKRNLIKLGMYTGYAWGLALIPALIYLAIQGWRRQWSVGWEKTLFLSLWLVPAVLFYALVHMGQQGLVFVFLPVLLLLSAVGLKNILETRPLWLLAAFALFLAMNIGIFCLAPEYPLGVTGPRLLTRSTIANSDQYYQARFEAIKENFPAKSTLILAANWHHLEYYLPEYTMLPFNLGSKWEVNADVPIISDNTVRGSTPAELGLQEAVIIIFDPELEKFNDTPDLARKLSLSNDQRLFYIELGLNDHFYLNADSFGVQSN